MAELEIHHHEEGGHGHDPLGQKVGILVAIFAVCVALVTIKVACRGLSIRSTPMRHPPRIK